VDKIILIILICFLISIAEGDSLVYVLPQAAFFSLDNNFQDYEFTRLNTYEKKEMSEELTLILSNNYYWNQLLGIIGNYCPRKQCGLPHDINYFCSPTYFGFALACSKLPYGRTKGSATK